MSSIFLFQIRLKSFLNNEVGHATIFKIIERNNGDCIITPNHAPYTIYNNKSLKREQRSITVHYSSKDKDFITINNHFKLHNLNSKTIVSKSKAVKSSGFGLIYYDIPGYLNYEVYNKKINKSKNIIIDTYKWEKGGLFYMMLVCSPDESFPADLCKKYGIYAYEKIINNFKFIILWTQMDVPATKCGIYGMPQTQDTRNADSALKAYLSAPTLAKNADACIETFRVFCEISIYKNLLYILEQNDYYSYFDNNHFVPMSYIIGRINQARNNIDILLSSENIKIAFYAEPMIESSV